MGGNESSTKMRSGSRRKGLLFVLLLYIQMFCYIVRINASLYHNLNCLTHSFLQTSLCGKEFTELVSGKTEEPSSYYHVSFQEL